MSGHNASPSPGDAQVTVIIPTLGRESLSDSLRSVELQRVPAKILVVNDSGSPLSNTLSLPAGTEVINTSGRIGAAASRNLGMQAATTDVLAFLDDDDTMLPDHLSESLANLDGQRTAISFARGLVLFPGGTGRVEPVSVPKNTSAADYLTGPGKYVSRCRRVLTPTLVFTADLKDHLMDPALDRHEDTWWLLTAESERGAQLRYSPHIGVVVHADQDRHLDRMERHDVDAWNERLRSVVPHAVAETSVGEGRDFAREGKPGEIARLISKVMGTPGATRAVPVLMAQGAAATLIRARKRLKR